MVLSLVVRKFFCQTSACPRRIFAERLSGDGGSRLFWLSKGLLQLVFLDSVLLAVSAYNDPPSLQQKRGSLFCLVQVLSRQFLAKRAVRLLMRGSPALTAVELDFLCEPFGSCARLNG